MQVLETERLVLRWLGDEDAEFIVELMNDPDWLRFIGDRGIRTADDARRYVATGPAAMIARLGFGMYAVELKETGAPIGICGLVEREWLEAVDLGFAFLPRFRGTGYAREAAAATLDYARTTLGLDAILAIVSPENHDSVRLLTKLGMDFVRMARPPGAAGEVSIYRRTFAPTAAGG